VTGLRGLRPNPTGITGWALLTTGFLTGTTGPHLSWQTLLGICLITAGGVLLHAVIRTNGNRP
jgi:hypothetical protein